jgi:hypothetical protein
LNGRYKRQKEIKMASKVISIPGVALIDPTEENASLQEPSNAVIYGFPGSGKTGLALTAPTPILIDFEKGGVKTAKRVIEDLEADGYEVSPDLRIVSISAEELGGKEARRRLDAVYEFLKVGDHPFETVILDPVGELQKLVMKEVMEVYIVKRAMGNQASQQDWQKALSETAAIIQQFRALPMHTIVTAHVEKPEHADEELHLLASGKHFKPFLEGAMDLLGYLYLTQAQDTAGKQFTQRVLLTQGNGSIRAKNRGNRLPDMIAKPNLTDIFALMDQ